MAAYFFEVRFADIGDLSEVKLCSPTRMLGARTCYRHYAMMDIDGFEAEITQNVCSGVAVAGR